jgi:hypothetical protein
MTLGQEVANTVPLRKPLMQYSRTELTLAETHSQSDSHILFPSGWRSTSQAQVWANTGSYIRVASRLLPQANALVAEGLIGKRTLVQHSISKIDLLHPATHNDGLIRLTVDGGARARHTCRLRITRAC